MGVIGLIEGPGPYDGHIVNCPKLLHLGWTGLMLNFKFGEIADFIPGWTTYDTMDNDTAGKTAKGGPAPAAGIARSDRAQERQEA